MKERRPWRKEIPVRFFIGRLGFHKGSLVLVALRSVPCTLDQIDISNITESIQTACF